MWRRITLFLPRFWSNWITLLGTALTTVAGSIMLFSLAASMVSDSLNIYASALAFLVMPMLFALGLGIVALGFLVERRRRRRGGKEDPIQAAFARALADARSRRLIFFVIVTTVVNIFLLGLGGHAGLSYMDSPQFCGTLCHNVMEPEYVTYLESPHSRVKCVQCHIGPGASWAVKSKVDGLRQVWGVMTDDFSRPVPSPVHELRPARDTCEQCHWPAKLHGNRIDFVTHYEDDEENTPATTALLLKVGGRDPRTDEFHGIHWHVSTANEVRYEALDARREVIGKVQVYHNGELVKEFLPPDEEHFRGTPHESRAMDCIDCHNRPTHVFDQTPRLAVDRAFNEGLLNVETPWLHAAAVAALRGAGDDLDREGARDHFESALRTWYETEQPDVELADETLATAATAVADLYRRNVYPHLNLTWEAHPNHLGHRGEEKDLRGCFRCHNDQHATRAGDTLSMDCELCHAFLAEEEHPDDLEETLNLLRKRGSEKD